MAFNSLIFFIFLAIFFAGWPLLKRSNTSRWSYLTLASFVFYGWWDWHYVFLLAGSAIGNQLFAVAIHRQPDGRRRKLLLIAALVGNVGADLGLQARADDLSRQLATLDPGAFARFDAPVSTRRGARLAIRRRCSWPRSPLVAEKIQLGTSPTSTSSRCGSSRSLLSDSRWRLTSSSISDSGTGISTFSRRTSTSFSRACRPCW